MNATGEQRLMELTALKLAQFGERWAVDDLLDPAAQLRARHGRG
jgi:hypothetical protein